MSQLRPKKRKCLVSGYLTDPNILGPTQTFLKPFGILKSFFRPFYKIFRLFLFKKVFIKKKFAYLPTLNFWRCNRKQDIFFFGLTIV